MRFVIVLIKEHNDDDDHYYRYSLSYLENGCTDLIVLGNGGVIEFAIECRCVVIFVDNFDANESLRREAR